MRSVFPGMMAPLGGSGEEPGPDSVYAGAVSVIGDDPDGGQGDKNVRRLPTVYLGNSPVFAARDRGQIRGRVERSVDAMLSAQWERPYLLQPCSLDGRPGLYWRDIYNRSVYRRRLSRQGVIFSEDPYPRFTDTGAFRCEDWGEFMPEFAIVDSGTEPSEAVERVTGGLLVFGAATGRFGRSSPDELALLVRLMGTLVAVSSASPDATVHHLRSLWN